MPLRPDKIEEELRSLLEGFIAQGIEYCLLKPYSEQGVFSPSDIDICVRPENASAMKQFLAAAEWQLIPNFRFERKRAFFQKIINSFNVKLDISFGFYLFHNYSCYEYNRESYIKKAEDGLFYLDDKDALLFLLKKAVLKRHATSERVSRILSLIGKSNLNPEFRSELSRQVVQKNFDELEGRVGRYFVPRRDIWGTVKSLFFKLGTRLSWSTSERTICFVGMDGSGKSTFVEECYGWLSERNMLCRCVYLGHSNFKLPALTVLSEYKKSRCIHGKRARFVLMLYLLLLPLEMLLRRGRRNFDVSVVDRHPMFERVFREGSPFRLYDRLLIAICPRPTLVIVLEGDAKKIWDRKKEMPLDDFLAKQNLLMKEVQRYTGKMEIIHVRTDQSFEQSRTEVFQIIGRHMLPIKDS